MKITNADGVQGILLNPYHKEGAWVFRVHDYNLGTYTDYDLRHSDLCVTINDADAFFYNNDGDAKLDHSPETLGIKKE